MKHIRIYNNYFGYREGDWKPCEISGKRMQDHHHIISRKMGGSKDLDYIENIMALTRLYHVFYGDKEQWMDFLIEVHESFMNTTTPWAILHPEDDRLWLPYNKTYKIDWDKVD